MKTVRTIKNTNMIKKNGILYIVPTPIGNLSDITLRALEILKHVDIIAAENVQHTQILLKHYGINNYLVKFNKNNEDKKSKKLIIKITNGKNIALVSNAGTPLINDPGFSLVNDCYHNNIRIVPLPGACALITALSASGMSTHRFCYEGFLPIKKISRCNVLKELKKENRTIILYEAPHRILDTMEDIVTEIGSNRYIVLAREISKHWESIYRGQSYAVLWWLKNNINNCKGEIVVIIDRDQNILQKKIPINIIHTFQLLYRELSLKKSVSLTAKIHKFKKNILYNHIINYCK